MKRILLALALAVPSVGVAEDLGCYTRTYSPEHLAANPTQGVAALRVLFYMSSQYDEFSIGVDALMSDQGQAARDGVQGQRFQDHGFCHSFEEYKGLFWCESLNIGAIRQTSEELLIEVGPSAELFGGRTTLAEANNAKTQYLLRGAPMSACDGLAR